MCAGMYKHLTFFYKQYYLERNVMGIVKTARLVYEYIRRDEEEKIEEVKRAIDGVDLDIKREVLWQC